jgi:hypothetical protein
VTSAALADVVTVLHSGLLPASLGKRKKPIADQQSAFLWIMWELTQA